ncbi:MAG: inosine/xanthosine triphosphatase [Patescibacteria group bacterium]
MKIIVASKNPVKINAAREGFIKMFPGESCDVEGIDIPSGVSHQPNGDEETFAGAKQRTETASQLHPDADFWVGIEGGVEEREGELAVLGWVVIKSHEGKWGKGGTGKFFLPHRVMELIHQGKELGDANDLVFHKSGSKQGSGATGLLTGDVITRTMYYIDAVVLALIPFKNTELY